jgi:type IV pilus assembly protein PilC
MAKFFYTAKSYSGENKSGEMEVKNERDLVSQLRGEGYILTSSKELKSDEKKEIQIKLLDRFLGISVKDKLMFARNLGVMIASGLPLSRALKNISAQSGNKRFSKILDDIFSDIQAGSTFSDGLAKYPAVFSELFVNMVRVGESSGNLEEVLDILAIQLEREHDINSKVKGAMTYPAVILVAMIGVGIVMLTYILPKMLAVFSDMDVELPWSTKFMMSLSDILKNHSILIFVGAILLFFGLKFFLKTEPGKKTMGFLAINVPLINNLVIKVNCARFARIYSSLLKSGVPVLEALSIISNTLTNYYYKEAFAESIESVQKGIPLSKVINKYPRIFPILITQMLEVGEETGRTEGVLLKLAEFYEDEISQITKNMSSIIEPFLMIIIGSAVGFFAVSMLQPMYSLMDNIK